MKHRATPEFWEMYAKLPLNIQQLADKNFQLLKADSRHPSLHFKKISGMWSARGRSLSSVGLRYGRRCFVILD